MSIAADTVICGAGMAGISAAYHLALKQPADRILLVDEREPLTLTSDKGTQAYRNWWPGPDDTMMRFISRSIDLMDDLADQCGNLFKLNRRGYVFLTGDTENIPAMQRQAEMVSALGAGPLRVHTGGEDYIRSKPEGFRDSPIGIDLVLDPATILDTFPFITDRVVAMIHARRCGWLDSVRLGNWLLERLVERGVRVIRDRVDSVNTTGGRVGPITLASGTRIDAQSFVIAAGPLLKEAGAMLGLDMPVINELHGKVAFRDHLGKAASGAPMMLWEDAVYLNWTESERRELASREDTRFLLNEFPAGVHFRPRGEDELLMIWTYDTHPHEGPLLPAVFPGYYGEICFRGLSRMIPVLSAYFGKVNDFVVDGGYYCKTRDNRPLIGPLPIEGAYVVAALSGYGIMASQAAGELLAAHVTGEPLPDYARAFRFERFDDPAYEAFLKQLGSTSGQL